MQTIFGKDITNFIYKKLFDDLYTNVTQELLEKTFQLGWDIVALEFGDPLECIPTICRKCNKNWVRLDTPHCWECGNYKDECLTESWIVENWKGY